MSAETIVTNIDRYDHLKVGWYTTNVKKHTTTTTNNNNTTNNNTTINNNNNARIGQISGPRKPCWQKPYWQICAHGLHGYVGASARVAPLTKCH